MRAFHLVTNWRFDAPIDRVWALIGAPERFPEWWPGFERAERVGGDGGVDSVYRYRVRGDFGIVFDFTTLLVERRPPEYLRVVAEGDFRGEGQWLLRERDGQTAVTYDWDVDLTRPGLRLAARLPGARGRLERSHDRVMAEGGRRLARLLAEEAGAARQMGG